MTKRDKLLDRLCRRPRPTDFPWDDLVTLFKQHDFKVTCPSGSHHWFSHPSGLVFRASRSHPRGLLKTYQIEQAIEALQKIGVIGQ